ncbi:hypothetical protein SK128_022071 [Halocaridina rubra]|uniref:Uncharacterized protein n=1 Tax=Halocaridina rubra TaxID=373956 RepID=A0AAN8ZV12_HALRR
MLPTGMALPSDSYMNAGQGACGNYFAVRLVLSETICALFCMKSTKCIGFNYEKVVSDGVGFSGCGLHSTINLPDGSLGITCYVLTIYSHVATSTSSQNVLFTSHASTEAPLTTRESTTTTSTPQMFTSVPVIPASFTGTITIPVTQTSPCASNGGVIGIIEKKPGNLYYFICKVGPNNFQINNPTKLCSLSDVMSCYGFCPANNVYLGFYMQGSALYGPCASLRSGGASINASDCHVVFANTQANHDPANILQWMYCGDGANPSKYYAITDAKVTYHDKWILEKIKCCRVQ